MWDDLVAAACTLLARSWMMATARNAGEAWPLALRRKPAVLLLDLSLAGGAELLARWRGDAAFAAVPSAQCSRRPGLSGGEGLSMEGSLPNQIQDQEEARRLAALRDLLVLDTSPEPLFDSITRMAAEVCGAPIALISLLDEHRQWFKSNVGLPGVTETARDVAFCAHAILTPDVMEVGDATLDTRFVHNPLVTAEPHVRFYAGAPLHAPGGERVGTLCVIDRQARQLSAQQRAALQSLSHLAAQALAMRRDLLTRAFSVRDDYEKALADSEARYRATVKRCTNSSSCSSSSLPARLA
eukprot:gene43258-53698_t